jgi:hypothetical protein
MDLNHRPPAPKAGALTRLRYAPLSLLLDSKSDSSLHTVQKNLLTQYIGPTVAKLYQNPLESSCLYQISVNAWAHRTVPSERFPQLPPNPTNFRLSFAADLQRKYSYRLDLATGLAGDYSLALFKIAVSNVGEMKNRALRLSASSSGFSALIRLIFFARRSTPSAPVRGNPS